MMISSNELRENFLNFFQAHGHRNVVSSPLVPFNDKTLLFTNAGMVQFKEVFLGLEKRDYTRAVSCQRCVRAGGKHNDLENVGYTARHHTFFEMLGNFSFGDYFKEEAIRYAWTFLTEVIKLPPEKLWVTVYEKDDEAADIWLNKIGVEPRQFSRKGEKDNFWQMGDTGPCGPCTEIFYDHGPDIAGGPPGSAEEDGDRYIEIWNLVFMQYDRAADGTLNLLPKPSVDTGMGLERLAAVLQGVHSNYETDLFQNLIRAAAKAIACQDTDNSSLRVIADHIRACAFLISDNILPSNEGRGYVLRRIIRRAVRHGYKLGCKDVFFYKLVEPLLKEMGAAYPELIQAKDRLEHVLKNEEERFAETLEQGMGILSDAIQQLTSSQLSGDIVFKLYDTYGFPVDLTADVARENKLTLDIDGFEAEMEKQRDRGRSTSKFSIDFSNRMLLDEKSDFIGYDALQASSKVSMLLTVDAATDVLEEGQLGYIVLKSTPFYPESGGQVGDRGELQSDKGVFLVEDTQKQANTILHIGRVKNGKIHSSDILNAVVNQGLRRATMLNHSATHLLHAALRKILGEHVQQKGSLVNEHYLRFDFSHFEPVSSAQLMEIEMLVNQQIRHNQIVNVQLMPIELALKSGAAALFGEKYGDEVRVLSIGDFSIELCGGTHVHQAGDIGLLKLTSESGIAAGIRRIEAVTGEAALKYIDALEKNIVQIAGLLKTGKEDVVNKVAQVAERNRGLEKELERLKNKLSAQSSRDIAAQAVDVNGIKVLAARMDDLDNKAMRAVLDQLKDKLGSAIIVLGAAESDNKVRLIAGVSKDYMQRIRAGELINYVAGQVGGKGGGRPDMAQAGGDNPAALDKALESVVAWVRRIIG